MADGHAENDRNPNATITGVGFGQKKIFNPYTAYSAFGVQSENYGLAPTATLRVTVAAKPKPVPLVPKLKNPMMSRLMGFASGKINPPPDQGGTPQIKADKLRGKLRLDAGVMS